MLKKIVTFCVLSSFSLFSEDLKPIMTKPGKLILEEDYSKADNNLFINKKPKFFVKDESLQIASHDPKAHSANSHVPFPYKKYVISFDLYLENSSTRFGFYLGGGHGLGLNFSSEKVSIKNGKRVNAAHSLPVKEWIPVMIERVDDELVLQINDSDQIHFSEGNRLEEGLEKIGIKCYEGSYKLDNVKVYSAEELSDWNDIKSKLVKS